MSKNRCFRRQKGKILFWREKKHSYQILLIFIVTKNAAFNRFETFFDSVGETSVYIMAQCHRVFVVGFVVPRGSIYRQRLSEKILQLAAGGLIDKSFQDVYDGVALLSSERGVQISAPVKLTLYHMQGGFIVWGLFMPLACLTFFIELCCKPKRKKQEIMMESSTNSMYDSVTVKSDIDL